MGNLSLDVPGVDVIKDTRLDAHAMRHYEADRKKCSIEDYIDTMERALADDPGAKVGDGDAYCTVLISTTWYLGSVSKYGSLKSSTKTFHACTCM